MALSAIIETGSTKERLIQALINLSVEKTLSSISVTELCATAQVSRMAFYRHFASKEDILLIHLKELILEYQELTAPLFESGELWYGIGHLTTTFSFFKTHSDFFECLVKFGYTEYLIDGIATYIIDKWGNKTHESEYLLTAFAGSLVASYRPWANNGFKETPVYMAELFSRFYSGSLPE